MTLENWAQLAEIAAALGVIVSLLYLAAQVRQGNQAQRVQADQSWMAMTQAELHKLVDEPGTFAAFAAETPSAEDKIRLMHWVFAALRRAEFEWRQFNRGVMDEGHFQSHSAVIPLVLGSPRTRELWSRYRQTFEPGFADFVDGMIADAPLFVDEHFRGFESL